LPKDISRQETEITEEEIRINREKRKASQKDVDKKIKTDLPDGGRPAGASLASNLRIRPQAIFRSPYRNLSLDQHS
jgi:hypothetical protein